MGSDLDRAEGAWHTIPGSDNNLAVTLHIFEADGMRFRVRSAIVMEDDNSFRGTSTIDRLSADGTMVLETAILRGSFVGTRMAVVPE